MHPSPESSPVSAPSASWWLDIVLALALFVLLFLLRPALPDGDGTTYAGQALTRGLFEQSESKHVFYEALLRIVALALGPLGLRSTALAAFTLVSNLAGAATYLLLARAVYPVLLGDVAVARICALGSVLSFGVLNASATIESYALALALDTAMVALCLHGGFDSIGRAALLGFLFVLAVGVHVTNVLFLPLLVVLGIGTARQRGWLPLAVFALVVALGPVLVLAGPWWMSPPGTSPLALLPKGDPEPPQALPQRLGRAVYGVLRTGAWIMPVWELTRPFIIVYGLCVVAFFGLLIARGIQAVRRTRTIHLRVLGLLLLLGLPFLALGLRYYPSDPERWLFLVPVAWLVIGRIWVDAGATLPWRVVLMSVVLALGTYNVGFKLAPETRANPQLAGLRALGGVARQGDLVVSPSGLGIVDEYGVGQRFEFAVLSLDQRMHAHPSEPATCAAEIRTTLREALRQGKRVYVFGLLNEGLVAGRGYPWAHVVEWGYTPEKLAKVIEEFHPEVVVEPGPERWGTYRLTGSDRN
jgi:hypothetical protein